MKTVEVVAGAIFKNGKVFATQRGYGEYKDGWEFPGGKIEPLETPEQALLREIKEELGIQIKIDRLIKTVEYDYPNFHIKLHCFKAELIGKDPVLLEHEDSLWVDSTTIDTLNWLPADLEIIPDIKNILNS